MPEACVGERRLPKQKRNRPATGHRRRISIGISRKPGRTLYNSRFALSFRGLSMAEILSPELPPPADPLRARITDAWSMDETPAVATLLDHAELPSAQGERVLAQAAELVARVRVKAADQSAVESFMRQYDLSSEEGVLLMCVAEALLRIPDRLTTDKLIRDKLGEADWKKHLGTSDSLFVNASTWGLMLTGRLVNLGAGTRRDAGRAFKRLIARVGEPVIRLAVRRAMRIMGHQFVMGRNIEEALDRSAKGDNAAYRYSYDMLGEAALTEPDAECIGTHRGKTFPEAGIHCFDGCNNSHQCHNTKSNDGNCYACS